MLPFDWRRVLIYTHRWLGIAGGVLFLSWFLSGIVMMYAKGYHGSAWRRSNGPGKRTAYSRPRYLGWGRTPR